MLLKDTESLFRVIVEEAEFAEGALKFAAQGVGDGDHRQAQVFCAAAEKREYGLDGCRAGLEEERLHEVEVTALDAARSDPVISDRVVDHLRHLMRDGIGGDGDEADAAEGNRGEGESVVAGKDAEGARELGEQVSDLYDVAGGLLDADDVGDLGQAEYDGGLEVDAGAAGNVVEQDGQMRGFCDGAEVAELALLLGLVVVRVGGEDAVEAVELRKLFDVGDGLVGGVVRAAGKDRNASGGSGDGDLDDP